MRYMFPLLLAAALSSCPQESHVRSGSDGAATVPAQAAQPAAASSAKTELVTTAFKVEGMTCESCSKAIESKLIEIEGVSTVSADDKTGSAIVQYNPATLNPDKIIAAIESLNFKATLKAEAAPSDSDTSSVAP